MPTLEWIGKEKVINHHQEVPFRVLDRRYSFDESGQHAGDNGSENMIIHGDNLEALKAFSCILLILTSCLFLIPSNIIFPPIFLKVGSSLSYGVFSSNIFLLWLILVFLVNSLGKSVK